MKQSLRRELKSRRDLICVEERKRISDYVYETVVSTEEYCSADTVLLYYPVGSEINLLPLAELALSHGKTVAFPVVSDGCMDFRSVVSINDFLCDEYGIPSPKIAESEIVSDYSNSICIVPALAVDYFGNRIGYGGGYYDRFLRDYKGFSLAVVYPELFLEKIPTDSYDIGIDAAVIFPFGVKRFA